MRPSHPPLSDAQIRKLSPASAPVEIRDGETRGLILTVLPSGRKQFAVRYRSRGKQRRLLLGQYPAVSLATARKRARQAQSAIDNGEDPAAERQAAKKAPTDTVAALAQDYLKKHARRFKKSAHEDERLLDKEVVPVWGDRSPRELTRRDVRALIERVVDRGAPVQANRLLALVRKMLNFGVDNEWLEANPAARIAKPTREESRQRVFTDDEIRRLWRLLENFPTHADRPAPGRKRATGTEDDPLCPVSRPMAAVFKMRLLTGQRVAEIVRMKWEDVDLGDGWWTIPAGDVKNGRTHRVPLLGTAKEIVESLKPAADDAKALYVFEGRGGLVIDRAKKASAAIAKALRIDARGHDLRRTVATRMAAAGVPNSHISKVLNHLDRGPRATRVYDRHDYDAEKRAALDTWDRTLKQILAGIPGAARDTGSPITAPPMPVPHD